MLPPRDSVTHHVCLSRVVEVVLRTKPVTEMGLKAAVRGGVLLRKEAQVPLEVQEKTLTTQQDVNPERA